MPWWSIFSWAMSLQLHHFPILSHDFSMLQIYFGDFPAMNTQALVPSAAPGSFSAKRLRSSPAKYPLWRWSSWPQRKIMENPMIPQMTSQNFQDFPRIIPKLIQVDFPRNFRHIISKSEIISWSYKTLQPLKVFVGLICPVVGGISDSSGTYDRSTRCAGKWVPETYI